jgi:hypothetical protein
MIGGKGGGGEVGVDEEGGRCWWNGRCPKRMVEHRRWLRRGLRRRPVEGRRVARGAGGACRGACRGSVGGHTRGGGGAESGGGAEGEGESRVCRVERGSGGGDREQRSAMGVCPTLWTSGEAESGRVSTGGDRRRDEDCGASRRRGGQSRVGRGRRGRGRHGRGDGLGRGTARGGAVLRGHGRERTVVGEVRGRVRGGQRRRGSHAWASRKAGGGGRRGRGSRGTVDAISERGLDAGRREGGGGEREDREHDRERQQRPGC